MQWGPDVDAKLFMYVLKIHNVKLDYQALAIAMGNDVTPKAITHRIAKLRQIADEHFFPTASASPGIGLPGPRHRGPNKRPRGGANTATTAAATASSSPSIATTKSSLGTEGNARIPLGAGAGTKRKVGTVVAGEFGTAESAESAFREFVELGGKGGGDCEGDGDGEEEGMWKKGRGDVGGSGDVGGGEYA